MLLDVARMTAGAFSADPSTSDEETARVSDVVGFLSCCSDAFSGGRLAGDVAVV